MPGGARVSQKLRKGAKCCKVNMRYSRHFPACDGGPIENPHWNLRQSIRGQTGKAAQNHPTSLPNYLMDMDLPTDPRMPRIV